MDPLKVSVLFYEDRSGGRAEHDEVVDQVAEALGEKGHHASLIGINEDVRELITKLDEQRPDLVFNLCETFAGNDSFEMHITALLDLLGARYTGTGPFGIALRADKAVAKKLLVFHQVPCPDYALFAPDELEFGGKMRFPLFVKPLKRDASVGIDESSLVSDFTSLMEQIRWIQTELNDTALVEQYIEGREFYVGILGTNPRQALPLVELDYSRMPEGHPRVYGREAKFDEDSVQFAGTNAVIATDLSAEVRHRILQTGLEAATALQLVDYARVDIRLSGDGRPYVIEVNANPYLEQTSAFAFAALQEGMGYASLVQRIVESAWQRWERTAPAKKASAERTKAGTRHRKKPQAKASSNST